MRTTAEHDARGLGSQRMPDRSINVSGQYTRCDPATLIYDRGVDTSRTDQRSTTAASTQAAARESSYRTRPQALDRGGAFRVWGQATAHTRVRHRQVRYRRRSITSSYSERNPATDRRWSSAGASAITPPCLAARADGDRSGQQGSLRRPRCLPARSSGRGSPAVSRRAWWWSALPGLLPAATPALRSAGRAGRRRWCTR